MYMSEENKWWAYPTKKFQLIFSINVKSKIITHSESIIGEYKVLQGKENFPIHYTKALSITKKKSPNLSTLTVTYNLIQNLP